MSATGAAGRRNTREFLEACERLLAEGHTVRFRAEGWSMYPTIRHGELIDIAGIDASRILPGDVVLCRCGSSAVAHRLVRIARSGSAVVEIVLRGDASFANDSAMPAADLIGRVTTVRRDGRLYRLDTCVARAAGRLVACAWRAKRWAVQRFLARISQTSARSSHACPW